MEFPSINTQLNIGSLLIHRYYIPTENGAKLQEDKIMISRIDYSYGIQFVGDKNPKFHVTYHFKQFNRRLNKFTNILGTNSFTENQLNDRIKSGEKRFEVINN